MIVRVLTISLLVIIFLSCNKNTYQYQSDSSTEIFELKKDNTFTFVSKDRNGVEQFNIRGDYRLKDPDFIEFIFYPVDKKDLEFLPINEAEVRIELLKKEEKNNLYIYHLLILESLLKEPIWGIDVKAFSKEGQVTAQETNREGKLTFESPFPIDKFVLQCENCVPATIVLKDDDSYSIEVIWEPKGGRYARDLHGELPDRGPIKLMKIQFEDGKIAYILQNDLSNKKFVKK